MAKRKRNNLAPKLLDAIASNPGVPVAKNAIAALGYQPKKLAETIATPEQARAIKAHLVRRLVTESVPAAVRLLENEVAIGLSRQAETDKTGKPKAPESAGTGALDAAKHLTNLGGLQAIAEEKDYGDMTDLEFRQVLERIQGELTKRTAVDVQGSVSAPDSAPSDSQVTDTIATLFS